MKQMFKLEAEINNEKLCLKVFDRIDTNNAKEAEDAIMAEINKNQGVGFFIDAQNLEYISSAGLRVILKLIKLNPNLNIVNVSNDVYEVFEMTGFTEMCAIHKAYRQFDVTNCKVIGEGAKGIVYRYDAETIIKVYKNDDCLDEIQKERDLAKKAFVAGVPTAISYDIVKVGNKFGSVFELLDSKTLSELIAEHPENIEEYGKLFASLAKNMHDTICNPKGLPNIKDRLKGWINTVSPFVKPATLERIAKLFDEIPERMTLIHGDYHTKNIMMQKDEALLIDMDTLSIGHPIIELGIMGFSYGIYNDMNPDNTQSFLEISSEQAHKIWEVFLKTYLETEDEEKIKEFKNKIDLITCVRIINHVYKRKKDPKYIELASNKLDELVEIVNTLDF